MKDHSLATTCIVGLLEFSETHWLGKYGGLLILGGQKDPLPPTNVNNVTLLGSSLENGDMLAPCWLSARKT